MEGKHFFQVGEVMVGKEVCAEHAQTTRLQEYFGQASGDPAGRQACIKGLRVGVGAGYRIMELIIRENNHRRKRIVVMCVIPLLQIALASYAPVGI